MDALGIEAFLAIIQTRSLTKAAELLHLSQSTVSYRLQGLERELGATLIERRKGVPTISLTPFGESFVSLAERWKLLKREIALLQSTGPQVRLTIGAADSLNVYVLPPLYQIFSQQCPSVRLQICTQHTMESYESMERKEIDVAFVKMERVTPGIVVEPFYVDEMVVVRRRGEERTPADIVSPLELDDRHQIYFNWGPSYQMWHDRWWDANSPSCLQVDVAALIFSLMWDARQWAIVPRSIAKACAQKDVFVVQRLSDPPPPRVCYQLTPKTPDPVKASAIDRLNQFVRLIYHEAKFR
ncbi:LysR family transcriptional regulator [Heliobacterium undosum]|uniref:LysR family transcriptional regulator n=1 Tax=Heliomicrobium undosum TaxID=121734 RepID=A0A845L4K9_9FIRM|nr:LysR family transcriptional regulator [Heliomicrobium undosum]MZP29580.1 LysR family transcriptional regulator [Heliomicrobium undosum]